MLGEDAVIAKVRILESRPQNLIDERWLYVAYGWIENKRRLKDEQRDVQAVRSLNVAKWSTVFAALSALASFASTLIPLAEKHHWLGL